jgi:hypothetical protein
MQVYKLVISIASGVAKLLLEFNSALLSVRNLLLIWNGVTHYQNTHTLTVFLCMDRRNMLIIHRHMLMLDTW